MFSRSFRFLSTALIGLCIVLLLIGCGGGGGGTGGNSSLLTARGRVQLPPGSSLSLTTLQAFSAFGTSQVAADGTFALPEPSNSAAIVYLSDANGKLILLGYSSTSSGPGEISPRTTAQVLLFYALGAQTLPPDQYAQALTLIAADNATAQLAITVGSRIAANPTALSDGDSTLDSAVSAAATAILPAGGRSIDRAASSAVPISRASVVVKRSGRASGQLMIQPSGLQSGVEIIQNPNGSGIVASNNFRRLCQFFVYKTGTKDQNGVATNFPQVQLVGGTHDLPSVVKINGVIGTLADLINGKVAYGPINSSPVDLPLDPGTSETRYEIVVVGFSTRFDVPGVFNDPRYANQVGFLTGAYNDLAVDAFVRDFAGNILITAMFAPNDIKAILGDDTAVKALIIDIAKLVRSEAGVIDQLKAGKPLAAWNAFVLAVANSSGFRSLLLTAFSKLPTVQRLGSILNFDLGKVLKANTILKAVELVLTAGDIGEVVRGWNASKQAEVWSVNVVQPNVHLDPQTAIVTDNQSSVNLATRVVGEQAPALRFVWSTTGAQGHLVGRFNNTPLPTGPITEGEATYIADLLKLKNGRSDTVTVKVFRASDLNTPIGSATSTITGGASLNCGKPAPPILNFESLPPGGPGTFTVTLDRSDYSAGDILTATVQFVGGSTEGFAWGMSIQNGAPVGFGVGLLGTPLTLDGKPISGSGDGSGFSQSIQHPGSAETHVVTFRINRQFDENGVPITSCGLGRVNGRTAGPVLITELFSHDLNRHSIDTFFNAGP